MTSIITPHLSYPKTRTINLMRLHSLNSLLRIRIIKLRKAGMLIISMVKLNLLICKIIINSNHSCQWTTTKSIGNPILKIGHQMVRINSIRTLTFITSKSTILWIWIFQILQIIKTKIQIQTIQIVRQPKHLILMKIRIN